MIRHLQFTALILLAATLATAQTAKWSLEAPGAVKWSRMNQAGVYIFATDKGLSGVDSESGKLLWSKPEFGNVLEFNVEEVPGLPILFVAENTGRFTSNNSTLTALNVETGEKIWQSEKLKGHMISIVGYRPGGFVVAFTREQPGAAKTAIGYTAFAMHNGDVVFEGEVTDKADLYLNERSSKFNPRFDLEGHPEPSFEGDYMYLPFAGLHKIDLNSGKVVWGKPFDVTEGHFKRTNSSPVIAGDVVYSSSKGVVRAFDKKTGDLKWTSKDFGAAVPELQVIDGEVVGRMGGTYMDANTRAYVLKKPLGIFALNAADGQLKWKYDGAKESTTNMVYDPKAHAVMVADARSLIGLNVATGAEEFRVKLEFKAHSGAAKKTAKALGKFAMGGVRGLAKKDNSDEDFPIGLVARDNGTVVVRAKQHLLSFKPATREIAWGVEYKAPGLPTWEKIATAAAFAMCYAMNTSTAATSQLGTAVNTNANNMRQQDISGMFGAFEKKFSASRASMNYAFMLTDIDEEDGKKTTPGIIGVNLDTGESEHEVPFADREPDYSIDEIKGIVVRIHKNGKQIFGYALK